MINHKSFFTSQHKAANRLVDYYEGKQLQYVKKILNGQDDFSVGGERHDWQSRGIIARMRNITKSIVDKSGLLFNIAPVLSIKKQNSDKLVTDETLNLLLNQADWIEFFQNVDVYTRLLKSTIVLTQRFLPQEVPTTQGMYKYNPNNGEGLILHMLHPGNSAVEKDALGTIIELGYLIDVPSQFIDVYGDKVWSYRLITPTDIKDFIVTDEGEKIIHEEINVDGIVPAVIFYDTKKPFGCSFPHIPEDLPSLQDFYNLHLCDLEFAIAWQKHKTLFIDRNIKPEFNSNINSGYGIPLPSSPNGDEDYSEHSSSFIDFPQQSQASGSMGGLGSIVQLENDGSDKAPMVKFDGPETDLQMLQQVVDSVVKQVAHDWDVNIKTEGEGKANSGFQLVVEEINNLNLREKRMYFFRAGLRKMYNVLTMLYPELTKGELNVEFAKPQLPVNHKEQQEIWDMKIDGGRATTIDYFMKEEGLSYEQALQRALQIIEDNKKLNQEPEQQDGFVGDID